jgi:MFS-type transporter involved in bile tolerance (Atg22 family)
MRHYYTVVDHENQSYGMALAVGSKGYITDSFASNAFLLKVTGTIFSLLVTTLLAALGLAKCRQRRWQKRLQTMKQMNDPNYFVENKDSKQSFSS